MSVLRFFRKGTSQVGGNTTPAKVSAEEAHHHVTDEWWWKPFYSLTLLSVALGMYLSVALHYWEWLDKPVTEVRVEGVTRHLDKSQLAASISKVVEGNILQQNVEQIYQQVVKDPWVSTASVSLDWPSTVLVSVQEEVPVARWGDKRLLNHRGDVFGPELKPEYQKLPKLEGPDRETVRVMAQFHDFNQLLRPLQLTLSGLTMESRGAWVLELSNGIRLVAGRDPSRDRFQRFIAIYRSKLAQQADKIEQIDMRYFNGLSVKWREEQAEADAK